MLHCLAGGGGGGGRGVTTDEKGVFIQIQNTIVSSKALVLVNCLNTFVHDCRHEPSGTLGFFLEHSFDVTVMY